MIPPTLSASSIQVADLCMARWEAEYANRSRGLGNAAANLGTVCHSALEEYVIEVYMKKNREPDLQYLLGLYYMYTVNVFGDPDHDGYEDGIVMLTTWFKRTDLSGIRIISTEQKNQFKLPTSAGEIAFNYIFDRFDQIGDREFKVVDYKSIRLPVNPEDLHHKVQPRTYALAAAIQLKAQGIAYDIIRIEFDLLRHERVGTFFRHEDNLQTWASLKRVAEKIIATPEGNSVPTLNPECTYCPIKAKCPELRKSISFGGAIGMSTEQIIDIRAQMEWQRKAVIQGISELDDLLLVRAREEDVLEFTTAANKMTIAVSSTRTVDADMVETVVGGDLFTRYGGKSITMASFDRLLKDPNLDDKQRLRLRSLIGKKIGDPRVKVESNGFV